MTVAHLTRLGAYLIAETATQDPKVGGPIRISTITEANGYQELSRAAIDKIVQHNAQQNVRLRKFFFGETDANAPRRRTTRRKSA